MFIDRLYKLLDISGSYVVLDMLDVTVAIHAEDSSCVSVKTHDSPGASVSI